MKNWKTTLSGLAAILTVVARILNDAANGGGFNVSAEDIALLVAGAGLWGAADSKPDQDGTKI